MYQEYAIEPQLLSNWQDFRYFIEKFGWDKGRLITEYPDKWLRQVYEATVSCKPVERKRIEEKLKEIKEHGNVLVRRKGICYQSDLSWLENVIKYFTNPYLHAIIVRENPNNHPNVFIGAMVDESDKLWNIFHGVVCRTANDFAQRLALILQVSSKVLLVDPHFDPSEARFTNVLTYLLQTASISVYKRNNSPVFELHILEKSDSQEVIVKRKKYLKNSLPPFIPSGQTLGVSMWKQKTEGERFHNRYILTELNGVIFGTGLDESKESKPETDDINRLTKEQHKIRLAQYTSETPAFDLLEKLEILGTKK